MNTKHEPRGPGRPALPAGEALVDRVSVRMNAHDRATADALAAALGTTVPDALRVAMHAMAARKVRS